MSADRASSSTNSLLKIFGIKIIFHSVYLKVLFFDVLNSTNMLSFLPKKIKSVCSLGCNVLEMSIMTAYRVLFPLTTADLLH